MKIRERGQAYDDEDLFWELQESIVANCEEWKGHPIFRGEYLERRWSNFESWTGQIGKTLLPNDTTSFDN